MYKFQTLNKALDKIIKVIFVILIGLIFYTYYRSEVLYGGLYRDYYLKYYIFLVFSLFILIILNFFNEKIKIRIYSILISIIFGFYICEMLLIDFKNLNTKTKYQYYLDLNKEKDAVVSIYPAKFILKNVNQKELFPLSGISEKLTIYCKKRENKEFVTYISDRYGFRNDDSNWDKKNIDFVLLGDSLVQGSCVHENKTINSQISQNEFDIEIYTINLGMSGNGPLLEYATLKEYLKYIKTKKVLYFFNENNDFSNLQLELKDPLLKKYLDNKFHQGLINKQAEIDRINNSLLKEEIKNKGTPLFDFIKLSKLRSLFSVILNKKFKSQNSKSLKRNFQIYNDILINLKKLTNNQNAELYFIYMPAVENFLDTDSELKSEIYTKVMMMVQNLNIKYIDIQNKLKSEHKDPLSMFSLRKNQHLNEMGYKFVAETIIKEIK
tara:strand:+ start:903 stop:2216 length:1314 start_codon:yes stop_codon:yes gene_type:complete